MNIHYWFDKGSKLSPLMALQEQQKGCFFKLESMFKTMKLPLMEILYSLNSGGSPTTRKRMVEHYSLISCKISTWLVNEVCHQWHVNHVIIAKKQIQYPKSTQGLSIKRPSYCCWCGSQRYSTGWLGNWASCHIYHSQKLKTYHSHQLYILAWLWAPDMISIRDEEHVIT